MNESVLECLGSPLVSVPAPPGSTIAAKLESFNPGGSAKDRPAVWMIEAAERDGIIEPGDWLVEPTSGNTGIGLALTAAVKGYDLTIVLPASKSPERRALMRAYGADLELVEGEMTEARARANELESEGAVQLGQFVNDANAQSHYESTAEEILEQVGDRRIDAFVVAVGTGGTLTGAGERLKEQFPDMEIVAVEPDTNAVLSTGVAGSDDFQGMGPGFVSELLDVDLIDSVETTAIDDAEATCRMLALEHGILVGQSSGAAHIAAERVATRLKATIDDPFVVTVFPDSGERYLSTGMFDA